MWIFRVTSILKKEAAYSTETPVLIYQTTRRHFPENCDTAVAASIVINLHNNFQQFGVSVHTQYARIWLMLLNDDPAECRIRHNMKHASKGKTLYCRKTSTAAYKTMPSSLNLRLKGLEEVSWPPESHRWGSADFHRFWCFVSVPFFKGGNG